jgi:hypothetical protein
LQATKETLRRLQLYAVVRRQTSTLRIGSPPALEAPEPLVRNAEPWNASAASAHIAGLEVEKPLEHRGRPGAVGLALAAVEQDHGRHAGAEIVSRALRAPTAVTARLHDPAADAAIGPRLDRSLGAFCRSRR